MNLQNSVIKMKAFAKKIPGAQPLYRFLRRVPQLQPQGIKGIRKLGHREYVGGSWELMQDLQFNFLMSHGLKPQHHLWDIACGSLRAGVPLIRYLEPGHYHGIDKYRALIDLGIEHELGRRDYELKRPEFIVSDAFEFDQFKAAPDYALAQSLFTHLPPPLILLCLGNLRKRVQPHTVFFASFLVTSQPRNNLTEPHDHEGFWYTTEQMKAFGAETGWLAYFVGDWNHPLREQVMMKFTPVLASL
jgi:hypothetical protein